MAIVVHDHVVAFEWMSMRAGRTPRVDCSGCDAAQDVGPLIYGLQVVWVAAGPIAANVVEDQVSGYLAHEELVCEPMRVDPALAVALDLAIARDEAAGPHPACGWGGSLDDLGPEPVCDRGLLLTFR